MNHRQSSARGSTLLELMVALSLALILFGGAALSVGNILRPETEKQTAELISTFLEQASLCAVRSQASVQVSLNNNLLSENLKLRTLPLSKRYDYTTRFGGNQNSIIFYPSGFASAGTIAVHGEDNLCIISQTISGARHTECSDVN